MDAPLRVGYVLRMFPQASETFLANEILELERQGAQVRIFSYRRPRAAVPHEVVRMIQAPVTYLPDPLYLHPLKLLQASQTYRRLEPSGYGRTFRYVLAYTLRERNPHTWIRFLQATYLALLLKASDVDHLHAHFAHGATRVAMLASMLTGIPYSFTAHAADIFSEGTDYRLLSDKIDYAKFALTVSQYNRAFLLERMRPLVNGSIDVLYNGVDLQKFSPDPNVEREDGYILGVGRLVEKKGFTYLVKACRVLLNRGHHFKCEIVGEGELRDSLDLEIKQSGLEGVVSLTGLRSQEELPSLYRRASVLAMPAVVAKDGNKDALPTVLLEALACGTPVVASRLTGIPEIIDHGENGMLVEPADPIALADAIEPLLTSSALRDQFEAQGRAKAMRDFDLKANVSELYRLFSQGAQVPAVPARP